MTKKAVPKGPSADERRVRDDWVEAVDRLVSDAEAWATENGWWVHRDSKSLEEDPIGIYRVPVLMIQAPQGRLIVNPIARFIVGAEGRVDLCVFPTYDNVLIVRTKRGWRLKSLEDRNVDYPWSKKAFNQIASKLMAAA